MIKSQADLDTFLLKAAPLIEKRFGLKRIGYFGSFARNEQTESSDIDFTFDEHIDSLEMERNLAKFLRRRVKRKVDVVPKFRMRKRFAAVIAEDIRYIENGRIIGNPNMPNPPRKTRKYKRYDYYIADILDVMREIAEFFQGMSLSDFRKDKKMILAVERLFEKIGEASKRIPRDVQEKYPAITWRHWGHFRNYLAHEYETDYVESLFKQAHETVISKIDIMQQIVDAECQILQLGFNE